MGDRLIEVECGNGNTPAPGTCGDEGLCFAGVFLLQPVLRHPGPRLSEDRGKHSAPTWQVEISSQPKQRRPPAHLAPSFSMLRIHRGQTTPTDEACSAGTYSKRLAGVRLLFDSSSLRLRY